MSGKFLFCLCFELLRLQHTQNIRITNADGQSSDINQNAVTYDLKAQIAVDSFGLYFKYSPVNLLDTSYGPKFHPMSAGILLMF